SDWPDQKACSKRSAARLAREKMISLSMAIAQTQIEHRSSPIITVLTTQWACKNSVNREICAVSGRADCTMSAGFRNGSFRLAPQNIARGAAGCSSIRNRPDRWRRSALPPHQPSCRESQNVHPPAGHEITRKGVKTRALQRLPYALTGVFAVKKVLPAVDQIDAMENGALRGTAVLPRHGRTPAAKPAAEPSSDPPASRAGAASGSGGRGRQKRKQRARGLRPAFRCRASPADAA